MDSMQDAQHDMRTAYYGGAPGIFASGTAWFIAALVAFFVSPWAGILALIIGGMFIFPVSVLLCKAIGSTGKHRKGNPLASLAISGTIWMVLSIPIAVGAALYRPAWFFPAMLLVIGSRYMTFPTIYGTRLYWIFGGALVAASIVLLLTAAQVFASALAGALVEFVFGAVIFAHYRRQLRPVVDASSS
ncbi:MAG: hypothetical protein V4603_07520 [Pseudomonadota bacterium]